MAIDAYMYFLDYNGKYLTSESNVDVTKDDGKLWSQYNFTAAQGSGDNRGIFEVEDFSFDIEQVLSIGSQSTGAGAGKVTFNPFSITRKIDKSSPIFYGMACSGTAFKNVVLGARKASGGAGSGSIYLVFSFKLVAVKTLAWSYDDEAPKETITFEYGGLFISYQQQDPSGKFANYPLVEKGWNRVKNVVDNAWSSDIIAG